MCKMTPCYRGLHVRRLTSRIAISSRKCQRRITINKAVSTTSVSPTGNQGEGHNVRHFSMVIMGLPAQLSAKFDTASHDARNPHEWSSEKSHFPQSSDRLPLFDLVYQRQRKSHHEKHQWMVLNLTKY